MTEEDRVEELEEKVEELTEELERVKNRKTGAEKQKEVGEIQDQIKDAAEESGISRRKFMKMLGGGAAGISAAALLPSAAGFTFRNDDSFKFGNLSSDQTNLELTTEGKLDLKGNDIKNLNSLEGVEDHLNFLDRGSSYTPSNGISIYNNNGTLSATDNSGNTAKWGSLSTEEQDIGKTKHVSSGGDLSQAFLDHVVNGSATELVVHEAESGSWTWDQNITIDSTNHKPQGITIRCKGSPHIEYTGDGIAITNDTTANISGQIDGGTFRLYGGIWKATGSPSRLYKQLDAYRVKFYPKIAKGWTNSSGSAAVCEWRAEERWCENNYFGGKHLFNDRALITTVGSNATGSMQDNELDSPTVGNVQKVAFDLSGDWVDCQITNPTVILGADDTSGFRLNGSFKGTVISAPEVEDAAVENGTGLSIFTMGPDAYSAPIVMGGAITNSIPLFDTSNASSTWNLVRHKVENGSMYRIIRYGASGAAYRLTIRENGVRFGWDNGTGFEELGAFEFNGLAVDVDGSQSNPAIDIGSNGAGLHINGTGGVTAVEESGDQTFLGIRSTRPDVNGTNGLYFDDGTNRTAGWYYTKDGGSTWNGPA